MPPQLRQPRTLAPPRDSRRKLRAVVLDPQTDWTRRRLQILLAIGAALTVLVTAGVVWSLIGLLRIDTPDNGVDGAGAGMVDGSAGSAGANSSVSAAQSALVEQDRLAEAELPQADLDAAQPGSLSTGETTILRIPAPTGVGPAAVATGFPRTPEGALAQLDAINRAALSSASVRVAQEVISSWAAQGGPTPQNWSTAKGLAALLESADLSSDASRSITIGVEASMGFIKGTVGADFAIPCIDFTITATTPGRPPRQVAAADCQRMVWQHQPTHAGGAGRAGGAANAGGAADSGDTVGGRWVIGAGTEPAVAPSLWPGSQESFDAGYQWLETTP